MGSHIPIRQLRRSSVNARPRGATFRGLVVSAVFTNTWATSPPLCRFSVSKRFPRCSSTTVGLRPLSRDISSGFSDSLFFPSALFNSPVRRFGRSSGTYSLEAGPDVSGHQLTAAHRTEACQKARRFLPSTGNTGDPGKTGGVKVFRD